jgi:glycosyltransferase involved in cell wall biosynthesis
LWLLVRPLRRWDYKAAQRADYYAANSTHIQRDIKKYYGRDSVVIHPPVDIKRFTVPEPKKREGFVIVSRHVPQKKIDVAVRACNQLGLPLKIIGTGPETDNLKKIAGPTVQFTGFIPEDEVPKIVASAQAFIFPALDDFGVVPVEAMAAGTPVIAYKAGGALDYVQKGKTGAFFSEQTPESLAKTLKSFDSKQFKPANIRTFAESFSPEAFQKSMRQFVQSALQRKK